MKRLSKFIIISIGIGLVVSLLIVVYFIFLTGTIHGVLKDEQYKICLDSVTITIDGKTTTTDTKGNYRIRTWIGKKVLSVNEKGFHKYTVNLSVHKGEQINNIFLNSLPLTPPIKKEITLLERVWAYDFKAGIFKQRAGDIPYDISFTGEPGIDVYGVEIEGEMLVVDFDNGAGIIDMGKISFESIKIAPKIGYKKEAGVVVNHSYCIRTFGKTHSYAKIRVKKYDLSGVPAKLTFEYAFQPDGSRCLE